MKVSHGRGNTIATVTRGLLASTLIVASCARTGTVGLVEGESETGIGTSTGHQPDDGRDDGTLLDLPDDPIDVCTDRSDQMGVGMCTQTSVADAFEPAIQWEWTGPDGDVDTRVIPLVANLDDDDGNGMVDLCDRPDVVVVAGPAPANPMNEAPPAARIYALDGATGSQHWRTEQRVRAMITPALADIDRDGEIEIVTLQADGDRQGRLVPSRLVAFSAAGTLEWTSGTTFLAPSSGAVAIADLDLDLDAEIMIGNRVFDHLGVPVFEAADVGEMAGYALMPVAVDLDNDDDLEVLWSRAAYHHDGTLLWSNPDVRSGLVQVANLNNDPEPEIIVTTDGGLMLLHADGTPFADRFKPADLPDSEETWRRPAAIHDVDEDRQREILLSAGDVFFAVRVDPDAGELDVLVEFPVEDPLGFSAGTAFDFLGDGSAEAMYADENELHVYEPMNAIAAFTASRSSVTVEEYPVVADVDNDGSAEIVIGSNTTVTASDPTVRVIGDAANRWVQSRRIWNQHTYHVTNIRENGQLPTPEPHHWERTNTFRTNVQIEGGIICLPEP